LPLIIVPTPRERAIERFTDHRGSDQWNRLADLI
jgi:hypothetical protein